MMDDLTQRLRERAAIARNENTGTALGDAIHFEQAAARIEALEAEVARLRWAIVDRLALHPFECECRACIPLRAALVQQPAAEVGQG